ncbi:MAG: hypothetical protein R3C25_08070 [Hyphomonadaceae bacterium]
MSGLFRAREAQDVGEYTDRDGAASIKERIETYWRAKGLDVQIMLVEGAFTPALRASRVDVRSDMLNGLPRRARSGASGADG